MEPFGDGRSSRKGGLHDRSDQRAHPNLEIEAGRQDLACERLAHQAATEVPTGARWRIVLEEVTRNSGHYAQRTRARRSPEKASVEQFRLCRGVVVSSQEVEDTCRAPGS